MMSKEFIEFTSWYDGLRICLRASLVEGVAENGEERSVEGVKPPCCTVWYAGHACDVLESYEDIMDMIYKAEL